MNTTQAESAPTSTRALSSENRIIRLPEAMYLTGLGRSSIYARMAEGSFPRSVSLGARAIGWKLSAITDWIDARVAASRKETLQ